MRTFNILELSFSHHHIMPFYLEQRPNDYFHEFLTVPQWYVHIFFEIRFEQIQLTIGWDWEFTLIHERLSGENDERFQMSLFFIIFLITLRIRNPKIGHCVCLRIRNFNAIACNSWWGHPKWVYKMQYYILKRRLNWTFREIGRQLEFSGICYGEYMF